MLKLEIKLNENLVEQEAKYPLQSIYQTLDKMFGRYNLSKSILADGTVCYRGSGNNQD